MSSVINTNVSSLNAQKNLATTQNQLTTALQRLSSGMRINSAKDDAAGLAISTRFTSQINGLNQAARNANDGISLTQTAEGAMNEIVNNLQRMRELAVQSLNASNSATDRSALDSEVQQLKSEVDRVAQSTSFNGVKVLDGTFSNQSFQVGANAGETISVTSIASMRTAALGAGYATTVTGVATTAAISATDLTLNGVAIQASAAGPAAGQTSASAYSIAVAINAASGTNVTATANATSRAGVIAAGTGAITAGTFSINGVNVGAIGAGGDTTAQAANAAAAINLVSGASGVTASAATGVITLTAADGRDIIVAGTTTNTGLAAAGTQHGTVTLTSTGSAGITVAGGTPGNAGLSAGATAASQTGVAVGTLDVLSVTNSNAALASIDNALATVSTARGAMGAYQNRFGSAIANLATAAENMSAARSRIQDADFASETANLTRAQILQQAGTAMLSQANQLPQSVLSLLK